MRSLLVLGLAVGFAMGCATTSQPAEDTTVGTDIAVSGSGDGAQTRETRAEPPPRSRTFRIGFWEFDLMALDREPRGTTFRLLDLRIFRLLDFGLGEDYHSFSLAEAPDLFNVFTTRHEGITHEHRLADVQALALAPLRITRESRDKAGTHVIKLPIVGDFYGNETEDGVEQWSFLYLFRYETER